MDFLKRKMDFYEFLHECRTTCLRNMPAARSVLSIGASGLWYFEWFHKNYPHSVMTHTGIDISPCPEGLPVFARWIQHDGSDLSMIPAGSIDLIFAGQFIEHISWEQQYQFLVEANRVLASGGFLVIDSPNYPVANRYGIKHQDHVSELSYLQMSEALKLSGFSLTESRGIMPVSLLGTPPSNQGKYCSRFVTTVYKEDLKNGVNGNPDESFIWWITARKLPVEINHQDLRDRLNKFFIANESEKTSIVYHQIGVLEEHGGNVYVKVSPGQNDFALYGPYVTYPAGKYLVKFDISMPGKSYAKEDTVVCSIDVAANCGEKIVVKQDLMVKNLVDGKSQVLEFSIDAPTMLEFRVLSHGTAEFRVGIVPVLVSLL
ncbi:class I SAM-dependent methyltransferase [Methanocella sp. MCL-LM]|uniref:class I SAM-dependent methyltransferase n=1 Tax=Methanocella sp. MCL-LM TaxID=3412035 RepID=UPI003C74F33E